MALPPMNPSRTAAGITVDPQTLERVVPTSRRKDGSVRKELKIRPGFTPQEDVGRFRGSRQQASDQNGGSTIPGSTRTRPPAPKADNPFASTPESSSSSKTKAQVKNEKRRERKKTTITSTKAWDESDDSDDGDIGEAFKAEDARRITSTAHKSESKLNGNSATTNSTPKDIGKDDGGVKTHISNNDKKPWPIEDKGQGMISEAGPDMGGKPDIPIPIEPAVEDKKDNDESETAILSPVPAGPKQIDPAAPTVQPELEWRTASSSRKPTQTRNNNNNSKPHPIQGGRKGPIGLAHPPPIESSKPNRPRQNSSRQKKPENTGPSQQSATGTSAPKPKTNEPRVRKEVKVRESGMGSLADRVKNLVIGTQGTEQKREKPAVARKSETTSSA